MVSMQIVLGTLLTVLLSLVPLAYFFRHHKFNSAGPNTAKTPPNNAEAGSKDNRHGQGGKPRTLRLRIARPSSPIDIPALRKWLESLAPLTQFSYAWLDDELQLTVTFEKLPERLLLSLKAKGEVRLEAGEGLGFTNAQVDDDFLGITVLYTPESSPIEADIIALHGLSGHALGSWKSPDNSDVWLRDHLKRTLPNVRIITWGYDTNLKDNNWKKSLDGIADMLLDRIQYLSTDKDTNRPIIFLSHSLGGLIIKSALVSCAQSDRYRGILNRCIASIFFGVPHLGIRFDDLKVTSEGKGSAELIRTLLLDEYNQPSPVLKSLNRSFAHAVKDRLKIIQYYETSLTTSSLLPGTQNTYMMVTEESASHTSPGLNVEPLPLEGDHRTMIKFGAGSENLFRVSRKIKELLEGGMPDVPLSREEKEEYEKCIQVFRTSDYGNFKDRNPPKAPETCTWFLRHPKFEAWKTSPKANILLVTADPGCGKSVLTKSLVDHDLASTDNRTTCYFFIKEDDPKQSSDTQVLAAILHQLFAAKPRLARHALADFRANGTKLPEIFSSMWRILQDAAKDSAAGEIVCIIDGLDELKTSQKVFPDVLNGFFKAYVQHGETAGNVKLKFLLTSRPYSTIVRAFELSEPNRLRGDSDKELALIGEEIQTYIKAEVQTISRKWKLTPRLAGRLEKKLLETTNQTYLWIRLVFDELQAYSDIDDEAMESTIDTIPESVDEAYHKILTRIDLSPPIEQEKAKLLLQILVASSDVRPMSLKQVYIALRMSQKPDSKLSSDHFKEFRISSFRKTVKDLTGLITRVSADRKVYFIHQTVKEFLLTRRENEDSEKLPSHWRGCLSLEECHLLLGKICINYIIHNHAYKYGDYQIYDDFLLYAALSWRSHSRYGESSHKFRDSILRLYDDHSGIFLAWFPVYWRQKRYMGPFPSFPGLIGASFLGDVYGVEALCNSQRDLEIRDKCCFGTALHWASYKDHGDIVDVLIRHGGDINSRANWGYTPLFLACDQGHVDTVRRLLQHEAVNLNSRNYCSSSSPKPFGGTTPQKKEVIVVGLGDSPVYRATCREHIEVLDMLLAHGADANVPNHEGHTALKRAMHIKDEACFGILTRYPEVDFNTTDDFGRHPLSVAILRGWVLAVNDILSRRQDPHINAKDSQGICPLSYAIQNGNADLVNKIIRFKDIDVNSVDDRGFSPLSWALICNNKKAVQLLLNHPGIELEVRIDTIERRKAIAKQLFIRRYLYRPGPLTDVVWDRVGLHVTSTDASGTKAKANKYLKLFLRFVEKQEFHFNMDMTGTDIQTLDFPVSNEVMMNDCIDKFWELQLRVLEKEKEVKI